jgi:hypothetical protein
MPHPLQTTIDRLPDVLEKNAPAMMRRMVARMRAAPGHSSHGGLFLKVGEEDLVREFAAAVRECFAPSEDKFLSQGISMRLSTDSGYGIGIDEFETSTTAFHSLCQHAAKAGIDGMERYGKDAFLQAMKHAFERSRMDARATEELMPPAKTELNTELRALYRQLDAVVAKAVT